MNLPIDIHSFSEIREKGLPYVDKTDLIYKHLLNSYSFMSICRPDGFGKSVLLSTIKAFFEGRRDLFEGLAIEKLNPKWIERPVFLFKLGKEEYHNEEDLLKVLDEQLSYYEKIYEINSDTKYYENPGLRINRLIREVNRKIDESVVVLVDDYDKPILDTLETEEEDKVRSVLKSFLMCFKSSLIHVRHGIITGKTRLGKLSEFSDINNISDLSTKSKLDTLCGFTKNEIMDNFSESVTEFAQSLGISHQEMIDRICERYDGYRFSDSPTQVMNPYSILNALAYKSFDDYWFKSVDPKHMVQLMIEKKYDITKLNNPKKDEHNLHRCENILITPMLYQNGYLTIKDSEEMDWNDWYTLDFPNKEVGENFLDFLTPYYTHISSEHFPSEISKLVDHIEKGDVNGFMINLQYVFFPTPYYPDKEHEINVDQYYSPYQWARILEIPLHNLLFIVSRFMNQLTPTKLYVEYERTCMVISTSDCMYVMEFIADSTPQKAIKLSLEKGIKEFLPTEEANETKPIKLVGVNYSTTERNITGWSVACKEYSPSSKD